MTLSSVLSLHSFPNCDENVGYNSDGVEVESDIALEW